MAKLNHNYSSIKRSVYLISRERISLIIVFFLFISSCYSQTTGFKNYNEQDGLPSSEVYDVMQDSKGYMWFSTDHGVSKFDGYRFNNFTKEDGLADNTIFESIEDYKGRIWFKSFSGRLSYYYLGKIYSLPINDTLVTLVNNKGIASFSVDSSDILYLTVYSKEVLFRIDLKEKCAISCLPLPENISYIATSVTGSGLVYGSRHATPPYLHPVVLKLYHFENGKQKLKEVHSWKMPETYNNRRFLHDKATILPNGIIATFLGSRFILIKDTAIVFSHLFDSDILNIYPDKSGNVWILFQSGSMPICYSKGQLIKYPVLSYLTDKIITSINVDREGGIWFTSHDKGVYYLNSLCFKTLTKESGLPGNKVNDVEISPNNRVWISLDFNELAMLNKDSIASYKISAPINKGPVTDILFHTDGTVWTTSNSGMSIFENDTSFDLLPLKTKGFPLFIKECNDSSVWGIKLYLLYLLKKERDSISTKKEITLKSRAFSLCKDNKQRLFIGTTDGLWEYGDSLIYLGAKSPLLKNRIDAIKISDNGCVWMATRDNGIVVMHNDRLMQITQKNGLISNFCQCLSIDYRGNIWVGTTNGLSHIIIDSNFGENFKISSIKNIVAPNLFSINHVTTDKNNVYVGTNYGLTIFDMDALPSNKIPPPIYITEVKINNKDIPLPVDHIQLSYNENYLLINFVGLTYSNAGKTQYRYKLEGIDSNWIYTNYTSVQYPKLAPGHYAFYVSAMNNDGLWSTLPASATFNISPPFWRTWWSATILISLISIFIYWRIKLIEKREKKKTDLNRQLANMELRELKKQIDPHFLFNNLNTLTHLIENSSENSAKFVDELSNFLRYTVLFRNNEFMKLSEEITQAERYIHLLKIRFGNKLNINWSIPTEFKSYYIPTYSLQLLIENVTKHNFASDENPINIEIYTKNTSLLIKNKIQTKYNTVASTGFGLESINERYRLLTHKNINIEKTKDFFLVELPLINPTEYENIAN